MTNKLEDFLGLVDVSEIRETVKEVINGKTFEFVIKPMNESEHSEFQKRCNIINKNKVFFDSAKYNSLVLDACIVEPDFKNSEFLKKANCVSAIEFLNKKFPAGILTDLAQKIEKLSGFESIDLEIESAKN